MKAQFIGIVKGKDGAKPRAAVLNVNIPDAMLSSIAELAMTALGGYPVAGAEYNLGPIAVEARLTVFLSVGEILKVGFMQSDIQTLIALGFNDLGEWHGPIQED